MAFTIAVAENCPTNFNDEFDGPDARPEVADPARRRDRRASFQDGALRLQGPRRRHDRRHGHGAERAAAGRAVAGPGRSRPSSTSRRSPTRASRPASILWTASDEPEQLREDRLHLQGHVHAVRVGRPRATARHRSRPVRRSRTPDGDVCLRVSANGSGTVHRRGLDRRRGRGSRSPVPITNLGDPETLQVRHQGLRRHAARDELRRVRLLPRGLLGSRRADDDGQARPSSGEHGELGWYTTRADGDADGRRRRAGRGRQGLVPPRRRRAAHLRRPVHGRAPGEHVVEYFAHGHGRGTYEAHQAARVPRRRHGARPADATAEGDRRRPVEVTLDAPDGDKGSGAVLTEYRVDGGPWTTYSAEGRADLRRLGGVARRSGRRRRAAAST